MRFEEKEDCHLDTQTGLEWSKDNLGPMTWQDAIDGFAKGKNGWRMPTIEELLTIVDYTKYDPATTLPNMVSSYYWSSTTYARYTDGAWRVDFYYGYGHGYYKSNSRYVRAVRGEKQKSKCQCGSRRVPKIVAPVAAIICPDCKKVK